MTRFSGVDYFRIFDFFALYAFDKPFYIIHTSFKYIIYNLKAVFIYLFIILINLRGIGLLSLFGRIIFIYIFSEIQKFFKIFYYITFLIFYILIE